jgi:hypothetical protein
VTARARWEAVARHTVWHRDAIPLLERKYASPLKRAFLPMYDAIAVLAGIYAIYSGIPSLDALVPQMVSTVVGFLFIGAAVVALIGIAVPAAWRLEIAGKLVLFGILGTYLIALRVLAADGEGTRDFVGCVVAMAMLVPLLRLWVLGKEIGERREDAA